MLSGGRSVPDIFLRVFAAVTVIVILLLPPKLDTSIRVSMAPGTPAHGLNVPTSLPLAATPP